MPRRWWLPAGVLGGLSLWGLAEIVTHGLAPLPPLLTVAWPISVLWLIGDILTTPPPGYDRLRER